MAALLAASGAYAQSEQTGILVYEVSFFADSRPNTAFDMIKRVPGFTFDAGATARGFAGTAGNVLIDGQRPTSKSDSLDNILIRIPAVDVERIELIRGGAPGIDMQGRTVIVNVVRKKEDSTRIVATGEGIFFPDGHIIPNASLEFTQHTGAKIYEASASLFGNYDDSVGHGRHDIFDAAGTLLQHDDASSHGMGIGGSIKAAATLPLFGGEFKANGQVQDSPFNSRLTYYSPTNFENYVDKSDSQSAELGLHWKGPVGGTEVELLGLQRLGRNTFMDLDTVNDAKFTSRNHTGETIVRGTARYLPVPSLTLEAGAEGAFNFLDGHTHFEIMGAPVILPSADARVEERRGEVFGQGTWKISDEWLLEAGARFEFSTISESGYTSLSRSFTYPKPRAVLTWSPSKNTQIRARYERIVGQLDFDNFIASSDLASSGVTSGNALIKPDQRTQYAVSFEQHFWEKGAIVVTLMHEQISDVVDLIPVEPTPGVFFDAPGNIGDGTNNEIKLELTVPLDKLGISNGLIKSTSIWDISEVIDPVTGQKRVISGQRPQNIRVSFSQDLEQWNSTWGLFFYNGWDEMAFRLAEVRHRQVVPPYVGVFWDYKPSPSWSIHVEADNLTRFIFDSKRTLYAGRRDVNPVAAIEDLNFHSQPTLDIQIRKTF